MHVKPANNKEQRIHKFANRVILRIDRNIVFRNNYINHELMFQIGIEQRIQCLVNNKYYCDFTFIFFTCKYIRERNTQLFIIDIPTLIYALPFKKLMSFLNFLFMFTFILTPLFYHFLLKHIT